MLEEGGSTWEVLQESTGDIFKIQICKERIVLRQVLRLFANSAAIALHKSVTQTAGIRHTPFSQHLRLRYRSIQICVLRLLLACPLCLLDTIDLRSFAFRDGLAKIDMTPIVFEISPVVETSLYQGIPR